MRGIVRNTNPNGLCRIARPDMILVVIDRATWDRGPGAKDRKLLGQNGKCCLGFVCLALGHTESQIRDIVMPEDVVTASRMLVNDDDRDRGDAIAAQEANDDADMAESAREEAVTESLAKLGFRVTFVGKKRKP